MSSQHYDWVRYWSTRDAHINLSNEGFLVDPGDNFISKSLNPHLLTLDSLIRHPCVILLGEPGSGKSTELHQFALLTKSQINVCSDKIIEKKLENYSTDALLVQDIFQSDEIQSWINGEGNLFLFLDSLDEAMITIPKVANYISNVLEHLPSDRLFLRVSCRSLDWPKTLETQLNTIWDQQNAQVIEIAPFRKRDIEDALINKGLNADRFFSELLEKEAVPLALKPITLFFLLHTFQKNDQIPESKSELYKNGCEYLCQELNQSRREARQSGDLSAVQRLLIAGRIATVMSLTKKLELKSYTVTTDLSETALNIENVIGFDDEINGRKVEVTISAIRETLNTGLFNMRGAEHYGFVHQTYLEFLAAWYINHRELSIQQIIELFTQSFDNNMKVIPQLVEVAAWLASFSEEFFEFLLDNDPFVLLLSDTSTISNDHRSRLTEKILSLYETDPYRPWIENRHYKFKKLCHPKINQQLLEIILNKKSNNRVRGLAIEIASACNVITLQSNLVNIALDLSESLQLRMTAANALIEIGDQEATKKLLPLARGEAGDDPDDELRGIGLTAVWPTALNTEGLFQCLTPIKNEGSFGSYQRFYMLLQNNLDNIDIEQALRWAADQTKNADCPGEYNNLINSIVIKAWEDIENPIFLSLLASTIYGRIIHLHPIIKDTLSLNPKVLGHFQSSYREKIEQRHALIHSIIKLMIEQEKIEPSYLTFPNLNLILEEDFSWALSQISNSSGLMEKMFYADIVMRWSNKEDPNRYNEIYDIVEKEPSIRDSFNFLFGPIQLNSPESEQLRKTYQWDQERKTAEEEPVYTHDTLLNLVEKYEGGERSSWDLITRYLDVSQKRTFHVYYFDITETSGWKEADEQLKNRIINCAKDYILYGDPESDKWFLTNTINLTALSGYRAAYLINKTEPEYFRTIEKKYLEKWIPVILKISSFTDDKTLEKHNELLGYVYQLFPQITIKFIIQKIDQENLTSKNIFFIQSIQSILDENINQILLDKINDPDLTNDSFQVIVFTLIGQKFQPALELFTENNTCSGNDLVDPKSIIILSGLILFSPETGWKVVVNLLEKYPEICKEVILKTVSVRSHQKSNLTEYISEEEVCKLSKWLFEVFPPEEDPDIKSLKMHTITPREEVGNWRNNIVLNLASLGTLASYRKIQQLSIELPNILWLRRLVHDAELSYRTNTWIEPSINNVMQLLLNNKLRLVQSANQLQDVINESLSRLQINLHGETPEVQFLWDKVSKYKYRPKEENRLSDFIKIHLTKDLKGNGIIINREVEIRPTTGSAPGENTDILVDAIMETSTRGIYDKVSVIIESKCIWNDNLMTDMKNQLHDRYLYENECHNGIYLVGWFDSENWDERDSRRVRSKRISRADLEKNLEKQALDLSLNNQISVIILDCRY